MISINKLIVDFGGFRLFNEISFQINDKDRIGLVGKNGAGKSTLLKIIAGKMSPSAGELAKIKDLTIGYLPQHINHTDTQTVREETEQAFKEIIELEEDIKELTTQIKQRKDHHSQSYLNLINDLSEKNERYSLIGGHNYHSTVEITLKGLGFKSSDLDRPTSEFSGGWRMRIELAKILLKAPDIFLLDEPTNHLDIESIQWLEDYLKSYGGAIIVISHDKTFLDTITKRTIEISLGDIFDYKTAYSKFVQLRHERREQQLAAYRNQQKKIEDTEQFIERFRYKATKAVQVQSRIKQLNKLERIHVDEFDSSTIQISFPPAPHSGSITVKGTDISKYYGSNHVLDHINFVIERGEKVAFVGKNGEGKTTLAKIIMNEIDFTGNIKLGHQVKIGYFAQDQAMLLDQSITVLETVDRAATGEIRTKIRDLLGAFLFTGEEVDKKVSVLSGGERTRLAMVLLLLEPVNFLILDEPTNHLDIRSKEIFKKALSDFEGTVLLISHDRDFLDGLVSKTYEFHEKKIKEYLGGIHYFLERKKIESLNELNLNAEVKEKKEPEETSVGKGKKDFEKRKEFSRKLKRLTNKITAVEENIEQLENKIAEMDKMLQDPESAENIDLIYLEYETIKTKLNDALNQWEKWNHQLEELKHNKYNRQ